jgi:hypothetical protein
MGELARGQERSEGRIEAAAGGEVAFASEREGSGRAY